MIERNYTREQISAELTKQGASPYQAWLGSAIAMAESGGRASATNDRPGQELSLGPFQLNLLAHPDVTAECARDLQCATGKAKKISNGFSDWSRWGAYTSGSYQSQLGAVPANVQEEIQRAVTALTVMMANPFSGITEQSAGHEIRTRFAAVPLEQLHQIVIGTDSNLIGTLGKEILEPEPGKPLISLPGLNIPGARNLNELIQAITKPENLWRVGFVLLGAAMIFAGARLYLTPETVPTMLKGAA